jgi:anti-sigma B factor antagonist
VPEFAIDRRHGPVADVVAVRGELDMQTVPEVQAVLDAIIADGERAVIADYSAVTFIDSMAVAQLIAVRRTLASQLRQLVIVASLAKIRRVLAITAVDRAVPVCASLPEAYEVLRVP